jgi:hypothetical protein
MRLSHLTGLVTTLAVALSIGTANARTEPASSRDNIKKIVVQEALVSNVPPSLALAVAKVESDFQAQVESSKGARGVMQIMPATGTSEWGVNPDELWDPRLNVRLGIDFLERLIERYDGNWEFALSYYNGGSKVGKPGQARVLPWTRKYVDNVLRWEQRYAAQRQIWMALVDRENDASGNKTWSQVADARNWPKGSGSDNPDSDYPTAGADENHGIEAARIAALNATNETTWEDNETWNDDPIRPRSKWRNAPRTKNERIRARRLERLERRQARMDRKARRKAKQTRRNARSDESFEGIEKRRRAVRGKLDDFS